MRVPVSLSLSLSLVGADCALAQSPGGVHPTVADVSSSTITNSIPQSTNLGLTGNKPIWPAHPAQSPALNFGADGIWNLGETADPLGIDNGGFRTWKLHPARLDGVTAAPNVFQYEPTAGTLEGWTLDAIPLGFAIPPSGTKYWRLRGYLSNQRRPGRVLDAAFEVIAPYQRTIGLDTVIVLLTPETRGSAPPEQGEGSELGRFAYLGWDAHSGLDNQNDPAFVPDLLPPQPVPPAVAPRVEQWLANISLMQRNEERRLGVPGAGTFGHNVIAVRVMSQLTVVPLRFQMQRNIEVVRAVQQMFTNPAAATTWQPPAVSSFGTATNWGTALLSPLPCCIEGGSAGGAMAMWGTMFFPEDFHGGVGTSATVTARPWTGEQATADALSALSGFSMRSMNLTRDAVLHFSSLLWGIPEAHNVTIPNWSPFFHGSAIRGLRENYLVRPFCMLTSDEDYVSHGNETVPWMSGLSQWTPSGVITNNVGGKLYWVLDAKNCHLRLKPFQSPFNGATLTKEEDLILDFLPEVVSSALGSPKTFVAPTSTENATEDPYETFLQPPVPVPPAAVPYIGQPLFLDTAFGTPVPAAVRAPGRSFGLGTRLGANDSMLVSGPWDGDSETVVFVGSAEGVVSKLAVELATGEVVPRAMSRALGIGAWAMAISEADGAPGKELIVATHRGLHVLDRYDLSVIQSRRDLPWDMTRPRHLRVADVVPGGYSEVVMVSDMGRLSIYDVTTLQEVAAYGEAGILDLEVLGTGEELVLALLSDRGHVVNLHWSLGGGLQVSAISPRLNGEPTDLERCDAIAGTQSPALAVLMGFTVPDHKESIWVLDAQTLAPVNSSDHRITGVFNGDQRGTVDNSHGNATDLEVFSGSAGAGFVMLDGPRIVTQVMSSGVPTGIPKSIPLGLFPPLMRAVDLAVDPTHNRLFVATEAGYVCWLDLAELISGTGLTFSSANVGVPTGVTPDVRRVNLPSTNPLSAPAHCNRTLSATWGMVADAGALEVIDQSGTRWSVTAAGVVTLKSEVGHNLNGNQLSPAPGPFRAMRKLPNVGVGTFADGGVVPSAPSTLLGAPFLSPTMRDLQTMPYQPGILNGTNWEYAESRLLSEGAQVQWQSGRHVGGFLLPTHQLYVHDDFVVFPRSGDVLEVPGIARHVTWWGGDTLEGNWQNSVQGARASLANPSTISNWWSTVAGVPPSLTLLPGPIAGHDLRNQVSAAYEVTDAQALRLFTDPIANAQRVALFTPGARLIVLEEGVNSSGIGGTPLETDAATGAVLDFGSGGMALAVGGTRVVGDNTFVDLYVGSQAFFATPPAPGATAAPDLISAIAHIEYRCSPSWGSGSSASSLTLKQLVQLNGATASIPKVYGVCGMAVGDLTGTSTPELVVGSMDGHLLVLSIDPLTGDFALPPVYQEQVEGAIGLYNSIVIADLDAAVPGNELYVAGSMGLRKWVK